MVDVNGICQSGKVLHTCMQNDAIQNGAVADVGRKHSMHLWGKQR